MKRSNFLKAAVAGLALAAAGIAPLAQAQDKGLIAISMPTKSSARWIADGANMVKYFKEKGNMRTTTSRTSSPKWRTW